MLRIWSRELKFLCIVMSLGMTLSGCSKSDSDGCQDVFKSGLLTQSCLGNSSVPESQISGVEEQTLTADQSLTTTIASKSNGDSEDSQRLVDFDREPDGATLLKIAGYNVITWDPRGEFQSGGVLELDRPDFEGRDVSEIIDRIRNH